MRGKHRDCMGVPPSPQPSPLKGEGGLTRSWNLRMAGQRTENPTTTAQDWGVGPGKRVWVGGHNVEARREIETYLTGTERPPTGPLDLGFIAPTTGDEAVYFAGKLRYRIVSTGLLWVVYPIPHSPIAYEFSGEIDDVVIGLFELGLTEIGRAQVGNNYTSTGFRPASMQL